MATTHPMKKPTAREEWNFLIIIVPPTLRAHNMRADQAAAKPSGKAREPKTITPRIDNRSVIDRMEYLKETKTVQKRMSGCLSNIERRGNRRSYNSQLSLVVPEPTTSRR
jgi:hypothetical protein